MRPSRMFMLALLATAAVTGASATRERRARRSVERTRRPRGGDMTEPSCESPAALFTCISECSDFKALTDLPISGKVSLSGISMFEVTKGSLEVTLGESGNVHDSWDMPIFAHVHDAICGSGADAPNGGAHWQKVIGGPADPTNEMWFALPAATGPLRSRSDSPQNNDVLVPPPSGTLYGGQSVVVHDVDGTRLGCCDLTACSK